MRDGNEFWNKDMTTVHDKGSWFTLMSRERRIIYCLIVLFIAAWCFLIGFQAVAARQPGYDDMIKLTAADMEAQQEEEAEAAVLTGSRVILVVGCDNRGKHNVGLTDTIMLVFMDMDAKKVDVISIPRDTYAQIPGVGKDKINAAYSNGGGVERTKEAVEYMTGISIDNYVVVDFEGFKDCIDAIGGVEVVVDQRMYKPSEGIDLKASDEPQVLNGEQSLGFVRYRGYVNGDLGRIEHQQYFMSQLAGQMLTLSNLTKVPELLKIALDNIATDMSLSDAVSIATYMIQVDMTNLNMHTVPVDAKWMPYGGLWISFVFVRGTEFKDLLMEITKSEVDLNTHFLDDGGMGRFSIPSDQTEPGEDDPETMPENPIDPENPEQGTVDPGTDPGIVDPGIVDPGQTDPGNSGDGDVDPWDIPEPINY